MGLIGLIKSIIFLIPFIVAVISGDIVMTSALSEDAKNFLNQFINSGIDGMADAAAIQVQQALFYIFQVVAAITYSVWMLDFVIAVNLVWSVLWMVSIFSIFQTGGGAFIFFYVLFIGLDFLFIGLEIYSTAGLIKEIRGFIITYDRNETKLKFKTHAQLLSFSQGVRDDSLILSCGDGSDITLPPFVVWYRE